MSESQRYFSLTVKIPISGITMVTRTGPLVEAWNRRHDRSAALCVTQSTCDGELLNRNNAYRFGTEWKLDLLMTGPLANDEKVAELSALMLHAICAPSEQPTPVESAA